MKRLNFKKTGITLIIFVSLLLSILYLNKKDKNHIVSDLIFSNVEALAAGENGDAICFGSGSIYCNGNYSEFRLTR